MTLPIDPVRRSGAVRRVRRSEAAARAAADRSVPAIHEPPPPPAIARPGPPETAFTAHLLGQEGQRRGLRGGREVLDGARRLYNRIEYSGAADRRAPKGRLARTKI
ncbi:hypothetical protein [Phenylobacterium koreense]|uniref:Uncharacterized protein n=1 Tax=Phenylobacterium koreense TaxID=266125 RepID=A0ABV2EJ68_9CAUL